jgi:hypothetical protein
VTGWAVLVCSSLSAVVDDGAVEEVVELLGVDAVRPLHLAVEPRGGGSDAGVADVAVEAGASGTLT